MDNRPRSREKRVTDNSKGVARRGDGLGTGPVGGGRPSGGGRASGGGSRSPMSLIIALIVVLLGGGGGAATLLSGGDDGSSLSATGAYNGGQQVQQTSAAAENSTQGSTGGSGYSSMYSGIFGGSSSSDWSTGKNTGKLNTSVAEGSRAKYTEIKGNGKDVTTIMVYMCGTDLESRSGMATNDLNEMLKATVGDNINLIVYTGGCSGWRNNVISAKNNQIYKISNGKLTCLENNMGSKSMTDPATLTEFINYCKKNYPANRNDLILWDHGGGSVTGYGYDEKYARTGSMNLSQINKALSDTKMKFDFIGYDACLMATAENALMLNNYADYLIASEETEPGVGWYYTNWLTALSKDPSMSTLEIGKNIIDDFVDECARSCRGQLTTLSIIDLAEFSNTVPAKLKEFAQNTTQMIRDDEYSAIATARSNTREFATSSKIDQIDLVDLAKRMGTEASTALADTLLEAVKYNRTATNMTNAYGVSIYFPQKKLSNVDNAGRVYDAIGMDEDYSQCIREFASLGAAGQTVAYGNGNSGDPLSSLLGTLGGSSTSNSDLTSQLLQSLLSSGMSSLAGGSGNFSFVSDRSLSDEQTIEFISENQFDASALKWTEKDGSKVITLTEEQWAMVTDLELNVFYDDGSGYVDMGIDNVFDLDDAGNLKGEFDGTWLAINGQPVAYYHTATMEDGDNYTITGYIPAMVNGERKRILLAFDQDEPYGYITGTQTDYHDGETETMAKADGVLQEGDVLEFLCDYYTYDGEYQDTFYLGEPMTVTADMQISNVDMGDGAAKVTYRFTDIYGMQYWSETLE